MVTILENRYHFEKSLKLDYRVFNGIVGRDPVLKQCQDEIHASQDGALRFLMIRKNIVDDMNKRRHVTFYYIFGPNESRKPLIPTTKAFQDIYLKHRVRKTRSCGGCSSPTNVDAILDDPMEIDVIDTQDNETTPSPTFNYFDSTEARLLFNPCESESVEWAIQRRLNMFDDVMNNPSKILEIIEDSEQHEISPSKLDHYYIEPTYLEIEKLVQTCKTHRNTQDQETGYISKLWRQAMGT